MTDARDTNDASGATLAEKIGARVRLLRHEKGMTQELLAEAASVTVKYLRNIEKGSVWISMGTAARLAEALGVELYYLLISPNAEEVDPYAQLLEKARKMPPAKAKKFLENVEMQLKKRRAAN